NDVDTRQLLNKLTGRAYSLRGDEFELRLNYERVGYSFGNENPRVVTAAGKRVPLPLAPARGPPIARVYEPTPADFFPRQWVHIAKPQQGTWFLDWLAVAKNEWGVPRFSLGGFGQPLFAADLFLR